jgi:hypothetical protein
MDFTGLVSCGKLPVIMAKCGDRSSPPAARGASGWHFGHQKKWAAEFTAGCHGLPNSPPLPRGLPSSAGTACAAELGCGVALPIGPPLPTVLDAPLLSSTDMACYSRPLAPPSSGKFTGLRVELRARARWPRDPQSYRCRAHREVGRSIPHELGALRSSPSPAPREAMFVTARAATLLV